MKKCNTCYLQQFKPRLYFHRKETIQPITWDNYIKNSKFITEDRISFDKKPELINSENINQIPFYGKVVHNNFFTDLIYIFIYPINPGYKICGQKVGYHTADIEHIIIRINNITERIVKVFFSSHSKEHQIWDAKDLLLDKNGCVKVFVSLKSHANYRKPKTYIRILGLANDITEDKGIQWHAYKVIDIETIKPKQYFKSIGMKSNNQYCVNGLFNRNFTFNNFHKINSFKRFFYPCFYF